MLSQHTYFSRNTCIFPGDFAKRLKRFEEEYGLSWSGIV